MSKQAQRYTPDSRPVRGSGVTNIADRRKSWSMHDLRHVQAKNDNQRDAIMSFLQGSNLAMVGSAGTGKTFLAIFLACVAMLEEKSKIDGVVIVRSAVQARDIGALPGTKEEKMESFEDPYVEIFDELFGYSKTYQNMKEAGKVQFASTSFLRGVTFDNKVVILDEVQNCNFGEINTVMTRLGSGSRVIVAGDTKQIDLDGRRDVSGVDLFLRVVQDMRKFDTVEFTHHDIVRSEFVKSWIIAAENLQGRT